MIVLGLTGSIGMGKSTVGAMLQNLGVPVHEADEAVHEALQVGNKGHKAIAATFPLYQYPQIYMKIDKQGRRAIDRVELGKLVFKNTILRQELENILHPLVHEAQALFIKKYKALGVQMIALDIPLLFETGADARVDYTLVVSAPSHIQRQRVLAREGMNEDKFAAILENQMLDGEKCMRADFVIPTGLSRAETLKALKQALREIQNKEGKGKNEQNSNDLDSLAKRGAGDFSRYTD